MSNYSGKSRLYHVLDEDLAKPKVNYAGLALFCPVLETSLILILRPNIKSNIFVWDDSKHPTVSCKAKKARANQVLLSDLAYTNWSCSSGPS